MASQFGLWFRLPRKSQSSLTCCKSATWDRRLYFPSEGRHAVDFYARKIWQLRPGSNLRSWVPEVSMLTPIPPKAATQAKIWHFLGRFWGFSHQRDIWVQTSRMWCCITAQVFSDFLKRCAAFMSKGPRLELEPLNHLPSDAQSIQKIKTFTVCFTEFRISQ
jgi:hypothetical protein